MRNKIIFIRSTAIGSLIDGSPKVGGIAVQLYFWAKAFSAAGWKVYTMGGRTSYKKEGITFIKYKNWGALDIIHEWLHTFWVYLRYRPDLVIERGAGRSLFPVARLAKLFHIKMVLFGASDVNFEPGKELISGSERNRRLFQKGIRSVGFFVVQNQHQQDTLKENYHRDSLILPNIWGQVATRAVVQATDVVWVANLRTLKRPEWMMYAAKALSQFRFTMVGGADAKEVAYYKKIEQEAKNIENMSFLGGRPFMETCSIISQAKVLVCTSTFEGFPNTFLQAWSYGIPVVSTVDPSSIIVSNKLGMVITSEKELSEALSNMLEDKKLYEQLCENVKAFFAKNYSSDNALQRLLDYCKVV